MPNTTATCAASDFHKETCMFEDTVGNDWLWRIWWGMTLIAGSLGPW